MATAVSGAKFKIESMICEGNKVAAYWTVTKGKYKGSGISIYTFNARTGKIAKGDTRWDAKGMEEQIGSVPQMD